MIQHFVCLCLEGSLFRCVLYLKLNEIIFAAFFSKSASQMAHAALMQQQHRSQPHMTSSASLMPFTSHSSSQLSSSSLASSAASTVEQRMRLNTNNRMAHSDAFDATY